MKISRLCSLSIAALLMNGVSAISVGQVLSRENREVTAEFYINPQTVDNAFNAASGEAKESEVQTEVGTVLAGSWQSEQIRLLVDYQYSETNFEKESQQEEVQKGGESELVLGNDDTYYQFTANHSVRRILREPNTVIFDLSNSEERQITSVTPLLRARLGKATTFGLAYNHSSVDFADSELDNSSRNDVRLILRRDVSPLTDLTLTAGTRDVDFDFSDGADYALDFVNLGVEFEHRRYRYGLEVGYSEVTPEIGEDQSSATFDFVFESEIMGSVLQLFIQRNVSDSSMGNENDSFFAEEVSLDGAQGAQDQVEREAVGLAWGYDNLCSRCALSLNIGGEKASYFNLSENDTKETFYGVELSYDFSRRLGLAASQRYSQSQFVDPTSVFEDQETTLSRFGVRYQINRDLRIMLEHEQEAQKVGDERAVRINSTGIRLTYLYP